MFFSCSHCYEKTNQIWAAFVYFLNKDFDMDEKPKKCDNKSTSKQ